MGKPARSVSIIGIGMTQFGKHPELTIKDLARDATWEAIRDAGIDPRRIEVIYCGNSVEGLLSGQEDVRGQVVMRETGLAGKAVINTPNACASSSTSFREAWLAVASGVYDIALAVGFEKLYVDDTAKTTRALASCTDVMIEGNMGVFFPGMYAMEAKRYMHDTGGPTQYWNIRREFQPGASKKRELYYSRVDRRIHLKGAAEGWIRVGHLGDGGEAWGEIRYFDTDNDGYFDRWEVHRAGSAAPVRVSTVRDPAVRKLPHDWKELQNVYTHGLLPEALRANEKLVAAMRLVDKDFQPAKYLVRALQQARFDTEKLYVQDIIRESQYLALREKLTKQSKEALAASEGNSWRLDQTRIATSARAWELTVVTSKLDVAYGEGRFDDAVRLLRELVKLGQKE